MTGVNKTTTGYRPDRQQFRGPYFLKTRYWTISGRYIALWQRMVATLPGTDLMASWMACEVVYYDPAVDRGHGYRNEYPGWCDCEFWCQTKADYERHLRAVAPCRRGNPPERDSRNG